jgi:hypothetical protein
MNKTSKFSINFHQDYPTIRLYKTPNNTAGPQIPQKPNKTQQKTKKQTPNF